jgi:hypothetical protein
MGRHGLDFRTIGDRFGIRSKTPNVLESNARNGNNRLMQKSAAQLSKGEALLKSSFSEGGLVARVWPPDCQSTFEKVWANFAAKSGVNPQSLTALIVATIAGSRWAESTFRAASFIWHPF